MTQVIGRLLVGDFQAGRPRPLGLLERFDDEQIKATGYTCAGEELLMILARNRRQGESDATLFTALPSRLRHYTWARDISPKTTGLVTP